MTPNELRAKILASIEQVTREGWKIVREEWVDRKNRCCCPLGACMVADGVVIPETPAGCESKNAYWVSEHLGIEEHQAEAFASAFDMPDSYGNQNEDYMKLAVELATEVDKRGYLSLPAETELQEEDE